MAKKKVVNTNLDQNLNGTNFNNTASETIFQFGSFAVTSNFDGRTPIDYTNTLSSFVRPVTLDTMGLNTIQSTVLLQYQTNAVLNLDKSNLNTFVKFGSTYEFFRVSIQEIILAYPGSLFANSNLISTLNFSVYNVVYNGANNTTTFQVPSPVLVNKFGLIFNQGNISEPNNIALKNLNLSYDKYVIWSKYNPLNSYPILEFTGDTPTAPSPHLTIKVLGNPFPFNTGITGNLLPTGDFDFHIKPSNFIFEEFRTLLSSYEQYIVAQRDGTNGFTFNVSDPTLLDDGNVTYSTTTMLWTTTDGYNVDIDNPSYQRFLTALLTMGNKYDLVKTDLIARFLTPTSIKAYDLTEDQKMTKLLRVYGWEFDQLKKFIDSLANINTVTYDKLNNIPDQLVSNLARTFGWNYFNLVNEAELVQNFLSVNDVERNLGTDLLPAEVNIELWRRILINTNYFWKSKGTRHAIKAMFLLIGIPEPFINITEYVYTVDGKINPNTVPFSASDFPNASLPYDNSGYPVAPLESPSFYFQISGDTDSGQAYMNNFRKAGYRLTPIVDNKKSWIQTGATTRIHYDTPQYDQLDSKLVLNTKEVDVSLDTARGIEYDVYNYIQKDFAANSSGFTLPYSYVNISMAYGGTQNTFSMPQKTQGDFEVRYNGILLNAPKTGTTTGITYQADYSINYGANTFTILNGNFAVNSGNRRDVIEATYIFSGGTHSVSGITVKYIVTRVKAQFPGTYVPLPSYPRGDIQVTINGIALTKGTPQFTADYVLDPANSVSGTNRIIIQNVDVISYLAANPEVQIAYVEVAGSNDINARSEITRVDSLSGGKIAFDVSYNKYVYTLNYKANDASDLKILIDGIALEPQKDYQINLQNKFQVLLPKGINFGSIISVYYLVGGNAAFAPIVTNSFGVGDISNLSFLEFIELIQRRLINVRTRKTISDFKGGWYPALLNVYIQYLKRSLLPENDPLHSNGYTFENLYPFLSKYNAFFEKFVNELLPATIILKQNGLLVRNTVFTKQKYMYKRGVNLSGTTANMDMRGLPFLQYLGDDGSQFLINQGIVAPPPIIFEVDTTSGFPGIGSILGFGGENIINYNLLTSYGVQYKKSPGDMWCNVTELGAPVTNSYTMSVNTLDENTQYMYQAFVISNTALAVGQILCATTLATPATPVIHTKVGTPGITTIDTGGINIVCGSNTDWYGMQYRVVGSTLTDIAVTPSTLSMPALQSTCCVCVAGEPANTYAITCSVPWIVTLPAVNGSPSLAGSISQITTCDNLGHIPRTGIVCYTPTVGTTKCVTVNQAPTIIPYKAVNMCCTGGISNPPEHSAIGELSTSPVQAPTECYSVTLCWELSKISTPDEPQHVCVEICCNNVVLGMHQYASKSSTCSSGIWGPFTIRSSDVFEGTAYTSSPDGTASVTISNITSISGNFCRGNDCSIFA